MSVWTKEKVMPRMYVNILVGIEGRELSVAVLNKVIRDGFSEKVTFK